MTENTITPAVEESAVVEAVEAPKVKNADLTPVEFPADLPMDGVAAPLLEKLYELNNEVREMVKLHRENDKGDDAAAAVIRDAEEFEGETDDEFISSVRKLAKLKAAVKSLTEAIQAQAQAKAAESDENGFDADKSRQDIRAKRTEGAELYRTILTVFELTGKVAVNRNATGAIEDVEALDAYGEALDAVSKFPNVRGSKGSASAGTSDTAKVRAWAKATGLEVGEKGRIPAEIVEAYNAAQASA